MKVNYLMIGEGFTRINLVAPLPIQAELEWRRWSR